MTEWGWIEPPHPDLVLLCEFCEHIGPKVLEVYPAEASSYRIGFDKEAFALRVLSVDYQRRTTDAQGVMADTQVVMREKTSGVFAYVHHFTLRDIQARGLVRPMCFCYISPDQTKIMTHFSDLRQAFSGVTASLKEEADFMFRHEALYAREYLIANRERLLNSTQADAISETFYASSMETLSKILAAGLTDQSATADDDQLAPAASVIPLMPPAVRSWAAAADHGLRFRLSSKALDEPLRPIDQLCRQRYPAERARVSALCARFGRPVHELAMDGPDAAAAAACATSALCFNGVFALDLAPPGLPLIRSPPAAPSLPRTPVARARVAPGSPSGSERDEPFATPRLRAADGAPGTPQQHVIVVPASPMAFASPLASRDRELAVPGRPALQTVFRFASTLDDSTALSLALHANLASFRHIVYSLLRGRPLVIRASAARLEAISHAVRMFSLFVPGRAASVLPLLPDAEKGLSLKLLPRYAIIGTVQPVPVHVQALVSVLDLDEHVVAAPRYDRGLLDALCDSARFSLGPQLTPQGARLYLAHLLSELLEIAARAFVFHHAYRLRMASATAGGARVTPQLAGNVAHAVWEQMGLGPQDGAMVEHIASVVLEQYRRELLNDGRPPSMIVLERSTPEIFPVK